jgi:lipopolysaccharide transport system ATP-binding protein
MSSEAVAAAEARMLASAAHETPRSVLADEVVIQVDRLGKCYEIYERPIDRLKQTLYRGKRQFYREFWALRDISFSVRRGETLGIIGRNGSGKSTLLQIIAGTLKPTTGEVRVSGRVNALLELGSGFNHEFTGRENVYLNGAILGLTTRQIHERFDEIAAFADIGEFLDRPVKTYSTGMVVRLAFAVQASLEPDILIIDEALAVGDAAFQMKCFNRMKQLADRGVSMILVTHDNNTVRSFCHRAIWLEKGECRIDGPTGDVTSAYVQFLFDENAPARAAAVREAAQSASASARPADTGPALTSDRELIPLSGRTDLVRWGSGELRVAGVAMDTGNPGLEHVFLHGERLHVEFEVEAQEDVPSPEIGLGFAFRNTKALNLVNSATHDEGRRLPGLKKGQRVRVKFELDNLLAPGTYALVCIVEDRLSPTYHYYDFVENALLFQVMADKPIHSLVLPKVEQFLRIDGP